MSLCCFAAALMLAAPEARADPVLADPSRYKISLYADLTPFGFHTKSLQLTITPGENGFAAGMYVTSPFTPSPNPDRLFFVTGPGAVSTVNSALDTPENLVFARGAYGDGMLISEPSNNRLQRLLADGTLTTFASLGTAPFGPTGLAYDAGGNLYATDFLSGNILRVAPDGSSSILATIPIPSIPDAFSGAKPILADLGGRYGSGLIVGTFSVTDDAPTLADILYLVSLDGSLIQPLAGGFSGLEFIALGDGGAFGLDLYASTIGGDANRDGGVFTVAPDGTVSPFLTSIDATHVVFDSLGVLGGGLFVSDFNESVGSARIWRITPVPEPGTYALLILGFGIAGCALRFRGRAKVLSPQRA